MKDKKLFVSCMKVSRLFLSVKFVEGKLDCCC